MTNSRSAALVSATVVAAAIVLWFWSGPDAADASVTELPSRALAAEGANAPMLIATQSIRAETVAIEAKLQGYTSPDRQVTLRAETAGRVEALLVERGTLVREGQPIVQLAGADRPAQQRKAAALVVRRENDYAAALELAQQGHLARTQVDESNANLQAARAELASIDQDIARTTLRAPFSGIVNSRDVELGDYVGIRDSVVTIVDNDPLIVIASVSQADRSGIHVGGESQVRLVTGEQMTGRVRYLSNIADESTRTFQVEIEISNPDGQLPAGVSAELLIPTREALAHRIAPGWLVRTSQGEVGVFAAEDGIARFLPVSIIRSSANSIWVTGLPASLAIVVSGQGFLEQGQKIAVASDRALTQAPETGTGIRDLAQSHVPETFQ